MSYKHEIERVLLILDQLGGEIILLGEDSEDVTIHILTRDKFEEGQLGYRVDLDNNSLIGDAEGDWKDSWFVIGYDEDLGDPIFVDVNKSKFPVYTAEHGMGEWEPMLLFESVDELL